MSKISDLSNAEISRNIIKYKQRVIDQPDHEEYGKILKALQILPIKRAIIINYNSHLFRSFQQSDIKSLNQSETLPEIFVRSLFFSHPPLSPFVNSLAVKYKQRNYV